MKVAILSKARPEVIERIPADLDYVMLAAGPNGVWEKEALAQLVDVDALLVSAEPVTEAVLTAAPKLKIVQRMGVGYNTLDLEAAAKLGIPCCNVAGVNKEVVAEHNMAMMLALSKKLREATTLTSQREWATARMLTKHTFELAGKTLGIIGLGDTGSELARRALAFEMRIIYNDVREINPLVLNEISGEFREKEALFAESDVVCVCTDLNDASRGMVTAARLALMKPTALFLCSARGGIVDEQALADTLHAGRIAGAGIDVFAEEPVLQGNPLMTAPNCFVTSHVAGVNPETGSRSFNLALQNVRDVVEGGKKAQWVVNGL